MIDESTSHDWFIETLPEVVDLVAQGEQRGEMKGELKEAQATVIELIKVRFPALQALAEERVRSHPDIEHLRQLRMKIFVAADEAEAQYWLSLDEIPQNDGQALQPLQAHSDTAEGDQSDGSGQMGGKLENTEHFEKDGAQLPAKLPEQDKDMHAGSSYIE